MVTFSFAVQMVILIAAGVIAKKTKVVDEHSTYKLGSMLINVGIPCLIIDSLNVEFNRDELLSSIVMVPVALITLAVLLLVGIVYGLFCRDKRYGAVGKFAMMFPNFTYIGMPVMQSLFGTLGLFQYTIFTAPIRIFFYSSPAFIFDQSGEGQKQRNLRWYLKVFTSPPLVGLYVGLIVYLCRIDLPGPVDEVLSSANTMTSTLGMIVCGMLMSEVKLKKLTRRPDLIILPLIANLAAPLLVMLSLMFLPFLNHMQVKIAVMYAALPFAAMLPVWVMKYMDDPKLLEDCSLYVLLSTVFSVGTMPLMSIIAEKVLP
ncbi:MAG: AEC family transporter [Oscillospiraceae bacterium]|jgi:predicted permease